MTATDTDLARQWACFFLERSNYQVLPTIKEFNLFLTKHWYSERIIVAALM
jgi:hypothetical protein